MTSTPEWVSVPNMTLPTVWMATPEGLVSVDLIAVELAMNGRRKGWTLSPDEARYAARVMLDKGISYSLISTRVGASTATLRAWFPGEIRPTAAHLAREGDRTLSDAACGTVRGYRRHHRRQQTPCQPCKDANAAADLHYRKHGTYKGAPEPEQVAL
ncbi:hypothetical protein [Streptomyces nigra]|uniref:hypothetical protein n=1 Tax=Streptomyces nigra TaxID=1827580 RepID=UPI00363CC0C8